MARQTGGEAIQGGRPQLPAPVQTMDLAVNGYGKARKFGEVPRRCRHAHRTADLRLLGVGGRGLAGMQASAVTAPEAG
ncbi:MAG: hypothetical protein OXF56_11260 [Rhodobacteraceae bacterium]|nr:hypothetical protein [Paracoccaceae bacterium]